MPGQEFNANGLHIRRYSSSIQMHGDTLQQPIFEGL